MEEFESNRATLTVQTVAIVLLGNLLYAGATKEQVLGALEDCGITEEQLSEVSNMGLDVLFGEYSAHTE